MIRVSKILHQNPKNAGNPKSWKHCPTWRLHVLEMYQNQYINVKIFFFWKPWKASTECLNSLHAWWSVITFSADTSDTLINNLCKNSYMDFSQALVEKAMPSMVKSSSSKHCRRAPLLDTDFLPSIYHHRIHLYNYWNCWNWRRALGWWWESILYLIFLLFFMRKSRPITWR